MLPSLVIAFQRGELPGHWERNPWVVKLWRSLFSFRKACSKGQRTNLHHRFSKVNANRKGWWGVSLPLSEPRVLVYLFRFAFTGSRRGAHNSSQPFPQSLLAFQFLPHWPTLSPSHRVRSQNCISKGGGFVPCSILIQILASWSLWNDT